MLNLEFIPESDKFITPTEEYKLIWESEGDKIVKIMEKISGLEFKDEKIKVTIYEGVSRLDWNDEGNYSLKLRASYPSDIKKATIIHELGHRLLVQITVRPADLDEHRILFLILWDIWSELYREEFANKMVEVEKRRKGVYDYELAWKWALSLTKEERMRKFQELKVVSI